MTKWTVLYRKELLELMRQYKLIWVPLVFILLGATQPVMSYFLPDILAAAGSLPDGSVVDIPLPSPAEVMMETMSNFNTLGSLVIALSFMSAVSGERNSGTAAMILVKPISFASFVTSKWAAMLTLTVLAFAVGYGASWYYTDALIGRLEPVYALKSLAVYALWIAFIGTLTIVASSLLRSGAAAAFLALGSAAVLSILSNVFPRAMQWSPGRLAGYGHSLLQSGRADGAVWAAAACAAVLMAGLLALAVEALRRKPSLD